MRLMTAEIDRYGPLHDCRPPCEDGVAVLSGPNEAGKTLYLEALLQLLEPEASKIMDPAPRVSEAPTGRIIVENGGDQYECGGDTSLCDISAIEPRHLQSVFVVQDNDLSLPSDQEYYTSLIEKLGDIHTTEINAIQSELKDRGRLTDARLNISSDQSYNHAGGVHDDAEALAEDIREYTGRIEEESLDELEARRLRLKRQLRESRDQLETQKQAKTAAEYERLSGQLETYQSTSDRLTNLESFDRGTLSELRELRNDLNRDRADLEDLESQIESKEDEVEEIEATLEDLETNETGLERRESAVDDARTALETYRNHQNEATGAERRLTLTKYVTVAGLLATGGVGVAGAITGSLPALGFGAVLLLTAIGSGVIYYQSSQRLTAFETSRESVLRTARDAGFDVESVEEVAPAIESFDGQLSQVRDRVTRKDQQLQDAEGELSDLRREKSDLESQITDQEGRFEDLLEAADVESIDEYEERVDVREELDSDRQTAKQSLVDRFGTPDADDPDAKARVWEQDLAELVADVEVDDVDADTYDESRLQELEEKVERLGEELDDLQAQLTEHDDKLDGFNRRARELNTQPFIGRSLGLDSRSKDGLEMLASDLDTVVDGIEEDAELSRKALDVFNRIEAQEEQKLANLFDPDGPASQTFEQVTGGRYTEVAYDAEEHEIVVERRDGRRLTPEVLSQGTKDQLYFATRVSLAQQLLGNESGFLLLDDPFLAADPERLHQGFETLQQLADDGWQILYLTAKQEVSETMVDEYDLVHTQMESLSSATQSADISR
jgi:exonuclease SbcC